MEQAALWADEEAAEAQHERQAAQRAAREAADDQAAPRLVEPNRKQIELRPQDLESLLPPCHRARAIWAVVERVDLSRFYAPIKARGSRAGRAATDPRVLVALWLYATSEGIGSAHELERLCTYHDAYRWLRGGVPVNYHTLSDFRTDHDAALDELFTQLLGVLTQQGLVRLKRVAQDGMRVRASAGASSFRRRQRLEEFLQAAREHVQAVKQQREKEVDTQRSVRQQQAQQRAAQQRAERIEQALAELAKIEQQRAEQSGGHKPKGEPRASSTDAEARKMKMGDGGFRPAFNAQLATDTESRVIVGVSLTENGTDYAQAAPMVDQIEQRTGTKLEELLVDGGFTSKEAVDDVTEKQVTLYGPVPERKDYARSVCGQTDRLRGGGSLEAADGHRGGEAHLPPKCHDEARGRVVVDTHKPADGSSSITPQGGAAGNETEHTVVSIAWSVACRWAVPLGQCPEGPSDNRGRSQSPSANRGATS